MKPINEIFEIKYGNSLELINCDEDENGIPFISRTSNNNGVVAKVKVRDDVEPMPGHAISVALGGSVLSSFYQKEPFYTSFHIYCLYPKDNLSEIEMIYYCSVIEKNKYRYNYGRQANKSLKNILIPEPNSIPENLKKHTTKIPFNKKPILNEDYAIDISSWKYFLLDDLFDIYTSKDYNLTEFDSTGEVPYISSTQANNGISSFIDAIPSHKHNTLTVARNGSVGSTFYQPIDYCASPDDVRIFKPKYKFNKYIGLFISVIIEKEKYRFAYGRKFGTTRMKKTKILLPVDEKGGQDFDFMENYIKSLPFSKHI